MTRFTYHEIQELFKRYNPKAVANDFSEEDAENATKKIEDILNDNIDCQNNFNYNTFINEWNRTFKNHYEKRMNYRKEHELTKLGFIIEVRTHLMGNDFYLFNNNGMTIFKSNSIPISKEIYESLCCLGDGVDFYILLVTGFLGHNQSIFLIDKKTKLKKHCEYFKIKTGIPSLFLELKKIK